MLNSFFLFFLSFFLVFCYFSESFKWQIYSPRQKYLGHLKQTLFFPSRTFLFLPNAVYCVSVTKTRTPTLRGWKDTKVSQQFWLRLLLHLLNFRYLVFSFPDAEFLYSSLMRSILVILYPVSQMQNFCIKLDAVNFRYLVSSFQMQNFCILAWCSRF